MKSVIAHPKQRQCPALQRRALVTVISLALLSGGMLAFGFARKVFFAGGASGGPVRNERAARKTNPTAEPASGKLKSVAPESVAPPPQSSAKFDLSHNVIAGGGGASSNGNFSLTGTTGQAAAGTAMSGGQFTQTGGFWQPEANPGGTPTPTPTPTATPTPTVTPTPTPTPTPVNSTVQFSQSSDEVIEACTTLTITVNRSGDTSTPASVDYFTSDVTASERKNYITAIGTLNFAAGDTSKSFVVLINQDSYVEGDLTFNVNLRNAVGLTLGSASIATVTIHDSSQTLLPIPTNVIDDPQDFTCQHYHDFLNRQPDPSGLSFWTNQITSCGSDVPCIQIQRINTSGAFFLSIEFQQTGYLVERVYKTAYGDATGISGFGGAHQLAVPIVRFSELLSDTQQIGNGVVVLQPGWEQVLENNKQAFALAFVQRARFTTAFPVSMTPAQLVDKLNQNAGSVLSAAERATAIGLFGGATDSGNVTARAQALRQVAEDADLYKAEFNRAFVLMQYLGYLRRDPNSAPDADYSGFDFWLIKLNQFNGDYIAAEMVKAFISSSEYRQRFGP